MALWIGSSDNGAAFVGSTAGTTVKHGGVIRRHHHQDQVKGEVKNGGAVTCLDRRQSTTSAQMLLRRHWKPKLQKRYLMIAGIILAICFTAGLVQIIIKLCTTSEPILVPPNPEIPLPPSSSVEHHFKKAAVCSDGPPCSEIGKNIFLKNGSLIDAVVATMFCNGLINGQSMGLGGGFMMTMYLHENKTAITLNAREIAPLKAEPNMFKGSEVLSTDGVLAVGVPGELKGYWDAHQKYGHLTWEEVISPSIDVCETGYIMTKHQADSLGIRANEIQKDPVLREMFVNPETGGFYRRGQLIRPTKICETLKIIAKNGGNDLYNGTLSKMLVSDIKEMGGIITEEDMTSYSVKWEEPITVNLRDQMTLFSTPPPGSGILLAFILNILDGYNFTSESVQDINSTILTYHRIIEAFKFAYARRTELGDTDFVNIKSLLQNLQSIDYANDIRLKINDSKTSTDPVFYGAVNYTVDDHGTAHVSIIAPNGDAASITSTVNMYFGAGITSQSTGIVLNSFMNDFSIPGIKSYFGIPFSPANAIAPGKRALSSMCPSIIVNGNGDVRLVIGASGGTKITTSIAYVIMRMLWFGENIKQAVDSSRIHHQIFPMEIAYDYGVIDIIVKGLEKLGHKTNRIRDRGSVICALSKLGNMITANADYRKGGDVFGID